MSNAFKSAFRSRLARFAASAFFVVACGSTAAVENLGASESGVERCADGSYCVGQNCYRPPYNICNNNCHFAANCGLDAAVDVDAGQYGNQGIVSCHGKNNGEIGGHTVNWAGPLLVAGEAGTAPGFCISEPQSPADAPACCWQQAGSDPTLTSGAGEACAKKVCRVDKYAPVAFEAGVPWDNSPLTCTGLGSTCATCCDDLYNRQMRFSWCQDASHENHEECITQVTANRDSCRSGCCPAGQILTGSASPQQQCAVTDDCPVGQFSTNNPKQPCLLPAAIAKYCALYAPSPLCP